MCAAKAGFILYPIHTLHIRMPSPSALEPRRVSKATQVSVDCTEHISEQQGDIKRPGDKNWPTIVFKQKSSQTHTGSVFFGCDIQRINVNHTVLKAVFFFCIFLFKRCFFRPKHRSVAGWKTVPETFDVPVSLQTGRLRKFYGSLSCPEVKQRSMAVFGRKWLVGSPEIDHRGWEWLVDGMIMGELLVGCFRRESRKNLKNTNAVRAFAHVR